MFGSAAGWGAGGQAGVGPGRGQQWQPLASALAEKRVRMLLLLANRAPLLLLLSLTQALRAHSPEWKTAFNAQTFFFFLSVRRRLLVVSSGLG